uniref:Uncharacterized protein n=1 Tax=viral metagenome TaxID=1070528 RepID=A0A6C0KG74_9ZZZZ
MLTHQLYITSFLFIPLIIWLFIIKYFIWTKDVISFIPMNILLSILVIPFIVIIYNYYTLTIKNGTDSLPSTFGNCNDNNIPEAEKYKGVRYYYNLDCVSNNLQVTYNYAKLLNMRSYYINYIIFFMIMIISNPWIRFFKDTLLKRPYIVQWLSLSMILNILCYIPTLLTNYTVESIGFYKIFSGLLNINLSLLILIMVVLYRSLE